MKSKMLWTGIFIVLLAAVGIISYYSVQAFLNEQSHQIGSRNGGQEVVEAASTTNHAQNSSGQNGQDVRIKNGKIQASAKWTNTEIMRTLHEMTHQKVAATQKWGAVPMTLENIKAMLAIVQQHKNNLDHYNLYINMLQMWKNGNFSQVDQQHNKLWSLEGGTVGKATGLLNNQQEEQFISQHFPDVKGTFSW